ncbi:MAG: alpha-amylase [Bacteroidetes bacterium]|nr:alpha-amylase [Bacteroidota bacterium]
MKKFTRTVLPILIVALFAIQCKETNVVKWPHGVNYEVFVRSYADSNGDSIGDFRGLISKLDYLKDLGIGGIWLMPIMPSPSYHKYDVTDYKAVDPQYGTTEDFVSLVNEAHKRGIRILVDLIVNHTGTSHPWFQQALSGTDNPYRDYYVWAKKDSIRKQISKKAISLDSDNLTQWHAVNGDTTAEHYYGFFWGGMPDLNLDNPKVREEFISIGRFWLDSMKVDGFRLDAAKHIFPTERALDNHAFWIWFREEMQKIKPDVYLVGEVWSKAEDVAPYLKGLPALFNFDMGYAISAAVAAGKDSLGLIHRYKSILDYYSSHTSDYIDATFLRNHDQNRILSELNGDNQKARLAASILFSLPGTPYVYYGEEIGMLGRKPDEQIREPFLWKNIEADHDRTRWEQAVYSTDATVVPLEQQWNDKHSIHQHYKDWITFRNSSAALTYGSIEVFDVGDSRIIGFVRRHQNESLLVFHNLSDNSIAIKVPQEFSEILFSANGQGSVAGLEVTLAGNSSVVLK